MIGSKFVRRLRDRLKRITDKEDVTFVKQMAQHPCNRLKKMTKNLEFDAVTLKEIPYINIDLPVDTTESKNKIMDRIIQSLPAGNDTLYTEHIECSNTFSIKKDPLQKEKEDSFQLILISDKKLCWSKNKSEQTELKRIKNQAIQMLEDFAESYVDL